MDIVERLRSKSTDCHESEGPLYLEAAAEIARLRVALESVRCQHCQELREAIMREPAK